MSSPTRADSFEIAVTLKSHPSRGDLADAIGQRIFKTLGIRTLAIGDGRMGAANNPFNAAEQLNFRLYTLLSKCEKFAVKGSLTVIVSITGGFTRKTAQRDILNALFLECKEAKLARAAQDVIDDLKAFKLKYDAIAKAHREKKMVEDALKTILAHLSRSEYCTISPRFDKKTGSFEIKFFDHGSVHPDPLNEEDYLWEPESEKAEIRGYLYSILNSGFPIWFYYHQWRIHRDDPEDFEDAEIEFRNLPDSVPAESDPHYAENVAREIKEAKLHIYHTGVATITFVANFFWDHVLNKALYAIPGVGTAMMVYDMAQLAHELPDDIRAFVAIIDDEDISS